MKIKSTPYPNDDGVGIAKMSITYIQTTDNNCEYQDVPQELTVTTEDTPASDDDEYYFVISTERWAIDNPEELTELLNDFKNRLKNAQHQNQTPAS